MSHRDSVAALPPGFSTVRARTATCAIAAMAAPARGLYAVQFHPEVVAHAPRGTRDPVEFPVRHLRLREGLGPAPSRAADRRARSAQRSGDRNVFFFVSGGVDSTVAYTLCLRALGAGARARHLRRYRPDARGRDRIRARNVRLAGRAAVSVEHAGRAVSRRRSPGSRDPEQKRHIIGEEFVRVQERILEVARTCSTATGFWARAPSIPTPSNPAARRRPTSSRRITTAWPAFSKLIDAGRIVEPLSSFYKDEVREIGRELGLPAELLDRHPFPGPGLAIRCLCAERDEPFAQTAEGLLLPVRSVGVQGDSRSYRAGAGVRPIPEASTERCRDEATELINRMRGINRVVARVAGRAAGPRCASSPARCRRAPGTPAARRRHRAAPLARERIRQKVWQFPVVLIPVGSPARPDSVVLRPIDSVGRHDGAIGLHGRDRC